jgi:HEAT repeat protein
MAWEYFRAREVITCFENGTVALPALITAIKTRPHQEAMMAAFAVRRIGRFAESAVPELIEVLDSLEKAQPGSARARSERYDKQYDVAFALGGIGARANAAVPALTLLLSSREATVRRAAASALGEIGRGAKRSLPMLVSTMGDGSPDVRVAAALASWRVGRHSQRPVDVIADVIEHASPSDAWILDFALTAAKELGPDAKALRHVLVKFLEDPDNDISVSAIEALYSVSPSAREVREAARRMLKDKSTLPRVRARLASILCTSPQDSNEGLKTLREILEHPESPVRCAALNAVFAGPLDDDVKTSLLMIGLSSDRRTRQWSASYLGALGPSASPALDDLRKLAKDDPDDYVRWQAADAVERISKPK